jgi:hypothetical protein
MDVNQRAFIERFNQLVRYLEYGPVLIELGKQINVESRKVIDKVEGKITNPNLVVPYSVFTSAVCEMNQNLVSLIENEDYFTIDPLARISMEHSVNLLYVLQNVDQCLSVYLHFFDSTELITQRWYNTAQGLGNEGGANVASAKSDALKWMRENMLTNADKNKRKWPNTFERFKSVGLEVIYRIYYASASDAVHALSEDIFNFRFRATMPSEYRESFLEMYGRERAAFSIDKVSAALLCQCVAMIALAQKVFAERQKQKLEKICQRIDAICVEYDSFSSSYWLNTQG